VSVRVVEQYGSDGTRFDVHGIDGRLLGAVKLTGAQVWVAVLDGEVVPGSWQPSKQGAVNSLVVALAARTIASDLGIRP
jgi:hypothetical protein